jgi:hypothetical protein
VKVAVGVSGATDDMGSLSCNSFVVGLIVKKIR